MYNDIVILLTACVDPGGMINTLLQDIEVRKQQYLEAIGFYLKETKYNIVFCENTDADFYDEIEAVEKYDRLEYITFFGNDYDKKRGKAYGEGRIIKYAMENSRFLKDAAYVIKVTGRIKILNINRITEILQTIVLTDDNIIMLELFCKNIAKSVCFAAPVKWLSKTIDEYGERLSESFWFETMLYDAVEKSAELRIKTYFPTICGINGTHNRQYNYPNIIQRKSDHYGTLSLIDKSRSEWFNYITDKIYWLFYFFVRKLIMLLGKRNVR